MAFCLWQALTKPHASTTNIVCMWRTSIRQHPSQRPGPCFCTTAWPSGLQRATRKRRRALGQQHRSGKRASSVCSCGHKHTASHRTALLAVLIPCPEIRCLNLARTGVGIAQMLISAGQASEPPVPGRWVVIWASTQRFLASARCPLPCTASNVKHSGRDIWPAMRWGLAQESVELWASISRNMLS